jgi:hypothetical protein
VIKTKGDIYQNKEAEQNQTGPAKTTGYLRTVQGDSPFRII